jgi:hydroxymethylglutaryl-CoA reductase (NADPH)
VKAEAFIPGHVVRDVLRTTVEKMVDCNTCKNHVGSAVAGALGGFNAHAANVVAAIFAAAGQDIAQVVESSQCITTMEAVPYRSEHSSTCKTLGSVLSDPCLADSGLLSATRLCEEVLREPPSAVSLYVSVYMPCLEVGTVGGGTHLPAQSQCIDLALGIECHGEAANGSRTDTFARSVAAAVLAGEVSLMAALAEGHLVSAHTQLNRHKAATVDEVDT